MTIPKEHNATAPLTPAQYRYRVKMRFLLWYWWERVYVLDEVPGKHFPKWYRCVNSKGMVVYVSGIDLL